MLLVITVELLTVESSSITGTPVACAKRMQGLTCKLFVVMMMKFMMKMMIMAKERMIMAMKRMMCYTGECLMCQS